MRNISSVFFLGSFFVMSNLLAQNKPDGVDTKKHQLIVQFNSGDSLSQAMVVIQLTNLRAALPNAEVEVVCFGPGLDLLVAAKSRVSAGVTDLSKKGITFSACNNSMKARHVKKEELLPVANIVPSAIVELTLKQEAGWAYFKSGN